MSKPLIKLPIGDWIDAEDVSCIYDKDNKSGQPCIIVSMKNGTTFEVGIHGQAIDEAKDNLAEELNKARSKKPNTD